ncbi:hypothetical protein [Symbiobacterium thermophilum]|uniref:Uncharacterized protein n=1 Tax=Symbiobacterium thermophilum TaxID=2734 RepID=A0A953IE54_SYMTR|nr:hypothetical protein [Symbiobacterium thermophilum]MBY6277689.1 hypothetical protein [Symbiobacterium thermophilum]
MAETLTDYLNSMERRVGALEEEQSTPDIITQITKGYGTLKMRATLRVRMHWYHLCSESLLCSEELII